MSLSLFTLRFSVSSQTLDHPKLERRREEKNIDLMSAARKTFTFERLKQGRDPMRGDSVQNDHHFRFIKTVIAVLHQTSLSFKCEIQQLKIVRALTNIILNLLVSLLLPILISFRSFDNMQEFSCRFFSAVFRLLCDADEAYERILSHLIF